MKTKRVFAVVLFASFVLAVTVSVSAEDLLPPGWRGDANSTLQIWEFSDDTNPAPADVDQNSYGDPEATIYGNFELPLRDTRWLAEDMGHHGVWKIGTSMGLSIPNDPELRELKQIRLQVTYDGGCSPDLSPEIDVVASDNAVITEFQLVQQTALDNVYTHAVYDLELRPNPSDEVVWILPRYDNVYVDEVVIDTICVPEPSTLLLLVVGAAGILVYVLKRKRLAGS